jgi:hypothetical protein
MHCPDPKRARRSDVPLADTVHFVMLKGLAKLKAARSGTRLFCESRLLSGDMDTAIPDINP